MDRVTAAIGLGSNLGDRAGHLNYAISRLRNLLGNLRVSRFRDTVPVGAPGPQPLFLNAAAAGETAMPARELLETLLAIEDERGRERPYPNAPRSLDLDLLLYGDATIIEPGLIVPHPRFRERRFVLEPLAEIAPDMTDPVTGKTISELLTNAL
ncbi:MAG TPA: 2-amino-4-hydroxy-6-hydroxymethyldihydropteridine diphosphokinase [Vicinamibacterales bacterium]